MHYAVLYNIKKTLKHKNNLKCAQSVFVTFTFFFHIILANF